MRSRMSILVGITLVGFVLLDQPNNAHASSWQQAVEGKAQETQTQEQTENDSPVKLPESARIVAEWEPAIGTMVAWPFAVPDELIIELANDDRLFVLVNPDKLDKAKEKIESLKISNDKVEFVECSVDSIWPRDWGPHQLFQADKDLSIVDHRFDGYPVFPRDKDKAEFTFRTGKGDDAVCPEIAKNFQWKISGVSGLSDWRKLFWSMDMEPRFAHKRKSMKTNRLQTKRPIARCCRIFLGIDRLVVLENTEDRGIQHIDCWMKSFLGRSACWLNVLRKVTQKKKPLSETSKYLRR